MSDAVDTSAEAVERLAAQCELLAREDAAPIHDGRCAATLRALLAELDAAQHEANCGRQAEAEAAAEVAALVAEAEARGREAGLREAAAEVDCGCPTRDVVLERLSAVGHKRASYLCPHGDACCALAAAAILARIKETLHD